MLETMPQPPPTEIMTPAGVAPVEGADPGQLPSSLIMNPDKALDMAHAGKRERSLAALGRQVNELKEKVDNNSGWDQRFDSEGRERPEYLESVQNGLTKLSNTYREETGGGEITEEDAHNFTLKNGWAPMRLDFPAQVVKDASDQGKENEYDVAAEAKEKIAEILYDNPPSDDFLRDNKLTRDLLTVNNIEYWARESLEAQAKASADSTRTEDLLSSLKQYDAERIKEGFVDGDLVPDSGGYIVGQDAIPYLSKDIKDMAEGSPGFLGRLTTLQENPDSTQADYLALHKELAGVRAKYFGRKADNFNRILDGITSGSAATYKSPE